MTLIVDASVAIKWSVREPGTKEALSLFSRQLTSPEIFLAEVGNLLTKKVRRREIASPQARHAFDEVRRNVSIFSGVGLAKAAFELSLALHHSLYDCWYLASADGLSLTMVTADAIFVTKVRATTLAPRVRLLGEDIPDD